MGTVKDRDYADSRFLRLTSSGHKKISCRNRLILIHVNRWMLEYQSCLSRHSNDLM